LTQTVEGKPLPKRLTTLNSGELKPAVPRVWFGEKGFRISKVEEFGSDRLKITFDTGERLLDENGMVSVGKPKDYCIGFFDQLVIGSGRLRDASKLIDESLAKELTVIKVEGQDFAVGAETKAIRDAGGGVRLIGAAGTTYVVSKASGDRDAPDKFPQDKKALELYQNSFPCMARVNCEGVTLCAATIAYANRYFLNTPEQCNHNANTASLKDLKLVIGEKLAEALLFARSCRVAPFKHHEHLVNVLERYLTKQKVTDTKGKGLETWPEFINNFNTDESLLDPVRLEVWKKDHGASWVSLTTEEKNSLKKLTYAYGTAGDGRKPDDRDDPKTW
jgi:hypothetical protein